MLQASHENDPASLSSVPIPSPFLLYTPLYLRTEVLGLTSDANDGESISLGEAFEGCCPMAQRHDIDSFLKHFPGLADDYLPVAHIGEGTFSTVYKAVDVQHWRRANDHWIRFSRQDWRDALRLWLCAYLFERVREECKGPQGAGRKKARDALRAAGLTPLVIALRDFVRSQWLASSLARLSSSSSSSSGSSSSSSDFDENSLAREMARNPPHFVAIKRINATSSPVRILDELCYLRVLGGQANVVPVVTGMRFEDQILVVFPYFYAPLDFRSLLLHHAAAAAGNPGKGDAVGFGADECACYMRLLFEGLAWIHQQGIMHRDIKPSNFLFASSEDDDGESRDDGVACCRGILVDFGLAQRDTSSSAARDAKRKTATGMEMLRESLAHLTDGYFFQNDPRYPFFQSSDDHDALVEIACVVGRREMHRIAALFRTRPQLIPLRIEREWRCTVPSVPEEHLGWKRVVQGLLQPRVYAELPGEAFDLLERCLAMDPAQRITAREALAHPFLTRFGHPVCLASANKAK